MAPKVKSTQLLLSMGVFVLIVLALTASAMFNPQAPVLAQDEPPAERLDASIQAEVWRPTACTILDLSIFPDRMHVRCTTASPTDVFFFAFPTDSANALMSNRILMLLNTAYSLGRPVHILYENQTTANPPGCLTNDCRLLLGLTIQP